jgi:excinuclease ABC subunit C
MLRDDKTYPYIKVTMQDPYPRVLVTRRVLSDGAIFWSVYRCRCHATRAHSREADFTVRSCHYALPTVAPERPCLDYFIAMPAPCVGYQSETD